VVVSDELTSSADLHGIEHLAELTVDVDGGKGDKVRIYCE
jgi:hypothetical protein